VELGVEGRVQEGGMRSFGRKRKGIGRGRGRDQRREVVAIEDRRLQQHTGKHCGQRVLLHSRSLNPFAEVSQIRLGTHRSIGSVPLALAPLKMDAQSRKNAT
jgi:hypothetical protein